ncbi:unnamed protein product [Oncorhynchus mykiss]|uniref:Ras-GEF domain-containing protein n=1 Tax=Oncorhynchus mykiss TaxID=8022 RepID=A0A060Z4L5_ONCMY|nr:unnamed protein product [Oncorhynchus mykiss]
MEFIEFLFPFQERLSYIGPEEFIQAFEKKDPLDNDKSCFSDHKKTSNLEAYVEWFNRLSFMVATEICMPVKKKKQRARVMEFFIDVARECFNIGNFNSLMAIICKRLFFSPSPTFVTIHSSCSLAIHTKRLFFLTTVRKFNQ